ncbi:MAG: DUF2267 domain-containing protein [Acidimicrobiales bacterium]
MQYDEFVGQVQSRARFASRAEAEDAIEATLCTLAEHLSAGAAENLAGQLPDRAGRYLTSNGHGDSDHTGEQFDSSEFVQRVAERERADEPVAAFHARAVLEVVYEATGLALDKGRQQLPEDFQRLLANRG